MAWSLPSWERGLKLMDQKFLFTVQKVAPLVGARIEICSHGAVVALALVAPLVGARIEIYRK